MTKVAPKTGEPLEPTLRVRLTVEQRATILKRQFNACAQCGKPLVNIPTIDEHILPLELGGSNELNNRALFCVPCAREKTRWDVARIAKARRLRKGYMVSKRPIQSRGFQKGLSRGFDGKVRPRD